MEMQTIDDNSFANRLRMAREEHGYSRKRLAELSGLSAKAIENYEYQNTEPTISKLQLLAEPLGLSVNQLMGIDPVEVPQETKHDDIDQNSTVSNYDAEQDDVDMDDVDRTVRIEDAIGALEEIDRLRDAGFENSARRASALIDQLGHQLKALEVSELAEVGNTRGLFPGECGGLLSFLFGVSDDFEKSQEYCGFVEERIVDTAVFNIDLYSIEERPLHDLLDKLEIENPDSWLPFWSWGDHEDFVPLLRPVLRSAILSGQEFDLTDIEKFPLREVPDDTPAPEA